MRLFVAIQLSDEMKAALCATQREMSRRGVRGNFTPEENLHLTLAFIGEYPDAEAVMEALSAVDFAPFDLALEGLGCFGDLWWEGLSGSDALLALANKVRRALAERGIPFDRKRFSPHITLIRKVSYKTDQRLPLELLQHERMVVNRISLMKSERGKNGMVYTEIGYIESEKGE